MTTVEGRLRYRISIETIAGDGVEVSEKESEGTEVSEEDDDEKKALKEDCELVMKDLKGFLTETTRGAKAG